MMSIIYQTPRGHKGIYYSKYANTSPQYAYMREADRIIYFKLMEGQSVK